MSHSALVLQGQRFKVWKQLDILRVRTLRAYIYTAWQGWWRHITLLPSSLPPLINHDHMDYDKAAPHSNTNHHCVSFGECAEGNLQAEASIRGCSAVNSPWIIAVSVSASPQKEPYKHKPVFKAAVLSIAPESSITCGSFGECAEGNLHVEANIRGRGPGCSVSSPRISTVRGPGCSAVSSPRIITVSARKLPSKSQDSRPLSRSKLLSRAFLRLRLL
jgi:hypothetical protein